MLYDPINSVETARRWKMPKSTVSRWRRQGTIPDYKAMGEPLDKAGRLTEQKLIRLVETGWLKARPLSRLIGSTDKINALITTRRYPDDRRFHVRHLKASEVKKLAALLANLQRSIGTLLYLSSITPEGQKYNNVVQADLRALLAREYLSTVNVRVDMNKLQEARFWAFKRGSAGNREDIDFILSRFKQLAVMLSE